MATTIYSGAVYGVGVYGVAQYGINSVIIIPDGVQGSCTTDSGLVIEADANHVVIGVTSAGAVGQVGTIGRAVVVPTGVEATGAIGSVNVFENELQIPVGVAATLILGIPVVVNTSFDYEAVKDQYDKRRTVYVKPKITSDARIVYVPAINRVVYIIGNRSTPFTRTKLAA